jgi:hypothetical protein
MQNEGYRCDNGFCDDPRHMTVRFVGESEPGEQMQPGDRWQRTGADPGVFVMLADRTLEPVLEP